jgi:phage-related protein
MALLLDRPLKKMVANMSGQTYFENMNPADKPLVWLHGAVKTPPFSQTARLEAGFLLRKLQRGELLSLPHSRPMPSIGPRCHELRINDTTGTWRIIYRIDPDAIVIAEVFEKKAPRTPRRVIELCQQHLHRYDTFSA